MSMNNNEHRYGTLITDDPFLAAVSPAATYTASELEGECPWWGYVSGVDDTLLIEDKSDENARRASQQWEAVRDLQIPGFAVSPFPHAFLIRRPKEYSTAFVIDDQERITKREEGDWVAVGMVNWHLVTDEAKWGDIKVYVNDVFDHAPFNEPGFYGRIARQIEQSSAPHGWDMPNPRVYWPDGTLAYIARNDRYPISPWLAKLFSIAIHSIWTDARRSAVKREAVNAFLDHHFERGGSPGKLVEHVEELIESVPHGFDGGLIFHLKAWVVRARSMLNGRQDQPTATKSLSSLMALALVHAYRIEADDDEAGIHDDTAQTIAEAAGFTAKSSGKTLLRHYRRYAFGMPANKRAERTMEGDRPGDVRKRFDEVVASLQPFKKALKIAEEDRERVRARTDDLED